MLKFRHAVIAATLLVGSAATAHAQLPTVQQLYDKYAKAVGGRDAWATVNDRAEKGSANIAFAGMTATYERYYAGPNKFRMIIDLGMGKVEQGTDGVVVWAAQPGGTAEKVPPADAAYALEGNVTGNAFLDPTRYAKIAVVGEELFDGVPCYKVSLTTKSGRDRVDYFEIATGLRRGQVATTAAGEQKGVFRDYKSFEGKLIATTNVQTTAQGDVIITIESVNFKPNDPALFVLPAGISR